MRVALLARPETSQFQGLMKRISPHLCRGPIEPVDPKIEQSYDRLLKVLRRPIVRDGHWQLLECVPAWEGNWTWDNFVAFSWKHPEGGRLIVAVNYSPSHGQCRLRLPFEDVEGGRWRLEDQLGDASYGRDGDELASRGLYLDVPPWQVHAFSMSR